MQVLPKSLAKSVDSMAARMSRAGLSAPKLSSIGAEPELQVQAEDNTSSADQLQSQQPLLPKGWESRKDPVTGRTFYIDHVNKVTPVRHSIRFGMFADVSRQGL